MARQPFEVNILCVAEKKKPGRTELDRQTKLIEEGWGGDTFEKERKFMTVPKKERGEKKVEQGII